MEAFPAKPLLVRYAVILCGPAALFLSSVVCLGPLHAGHSFLTFFPQFLEFLTSPETKGKQLLAIFFNKLQLLPIVAYGIFAAKATAFHFIPVTAMPGGRLVIEISKKRNESLIARALNCFSSIFALVLVVCIVIAAVGILRHR